MSQAVAILLTLCLVRALEGFLTCPSKERTVSFPEYGSAVLPCLFRPSLKVSGQLMKVSWQKEHKMDDLVVHFQNGNDTGDKQNEIFKGRTMMSKNWFVQGNATLTLEHLKKVDAGKYTCWITMYPIRPESQRRCCVVMLNISEQQFLKKSTSRGDDNSPPLSDRLMAILLSALVLALFLLIPFRLFNQRYFNSRRTTNL